jgi:hypothetical protein
MGLMLVAIVAGNRDSTSDVTKWTRFVPVYPAS